VFFLCKERTKETPTKIERCSIFIKKKKRVIPPAGYGVESSLPTFFQESRCKESTEKYSTKFSLFNSRFSRTAVKNSGFPDFPPFSTQPVEKNSTAIFPAVTELCRFFHGFNTPYYYYENS